MRTITDHIVEGDLPQNQLTIEVTDEPGQGGANHRYEISGFDVSKNPSADPDWFPMLTYLFFQNGPIKEFGLNGVTNEVLAAIVIDRLRSFQAGPFAGDYNARALEHFEQGLHWLQQRTVDRLKRGVEGTNQK